MPKITCCYGTFKTSLFEKLSKIKLVVLDVDGTLTDGGIYLDNDQGEYKKFNTKDGYGLVALQKSGTICAVLTGRKSNLVARRCKELGIAHVLQGHRDKGPEMLKLIESLGLQQDEVIAIGDDLNDLPMFNNCGLVACPVDAHPYVQSIADIVLSFKGGKGAVRQLCDLIMMSKDQLNLNGGNE